MQRVDPETSLRVPDTPVEVRFHARHPWAILPYKVKVDQGAARERASLYAQEFRWLRANRVPELCWPWRLGAELGWVVPSPVDVTFTPLGETEVDPEAEDLALLGDITGAAELWRRERAAFAIPRAPWLRLHQYRVGDAWHAMFLPNGAGAAEWHLGWDVEIPEGTFLLVMPGPAISGLEVPMGVLDRRALVRAREGEGMSIAVRPGTTAEVRRGDPVARLVLLDAKSLTAKAVFEPAPPISSSEEG